MTIPARLFICYSRGAQEEAKKIAAQMEHFVSRVFFDEHAIQAGDSVSFRIWMSIRSCDAALVIVDPKFCEGGYRQWELRALLHRFRGDRSLHLIPVLVHGATRSALPAELTSRSAIAWEPGSELQLANALGDRFSRHRHGALALGAGLLSILTMSLIALQPQRMIGPSSADETSEHEVEGPRATSSDDSSTTTAEPAPAPFEARILSPPPSPPCKPRIDKERLGSIVKPRDRSSHFELIPRRCPGGRTRVEEPVVRVDPGGTCEATWRSASDDESCEVDVMVAGPSFRETRCQVFVKLRTDAPAKCSR